MAGTPKDLRGAIKNGLDELRETKTSKCGPEFIDAAVELIHKHVQDRLAQDFNVAMINRDSAEFLWKKLFGEVKSGQQ